MSTDHWTDEPGDWALVFPSELDAVERVRADSMVHRQALITLYRQVVHCDRASVPGALVECGVWKGGAAALMAIAHLASGEPTREIHLFDSFIGIPEPDATVDGARAVREVGGDTHAGGALRVAHDYSDWGGPGSAEHSLALLESVGYDPDLVRIHTGWFQETVPVAAPSIPEIAVLHLDADWYASTRVCLDGLFPAVAPGGFVMIDDYGCYEGCRHAVDEFLAALTDPPFLHVVNAEVRYLQTNARF